MEAFLAGVAPRLLPEGYMRPLHNWQFAVFAFAIWVIGGALLGGVLGLLAWLLRRRPPFGLAIRPGFLPSCAALSVTAALAVHLSRPHARGELGVSALALCGLVAVVQLGGAVSETWARRTAVLANPWAASATILGSLWVAGTFLWQSGELARWLGAGGVLAAVGLLSWLTLSGLRRITSAPSLVGHALLTCAASLVVLGAATYPPTRASLRNLDTGPFAAGVERPNVVLVVWDTVRADHLSLYGYERDTTPFLREFARGATVYRRAWSTGDMTLTSHASMFTGLYGSTHGAHLADPSERPEGDFGSPLADHHATLAEVLSAAGYFTAGLVANHIYLSEAYGLHQGFRFYEVSAPFWGKPQPFLLRQPL
ncbi:MAG: sulfatase-like hydrolase/transferase, partial [Bryobacterales bacterium]|nr:sulfatase-like hydrolase/transferase [Bryobacterales bacterium]